jgi:UDP-glucose 4-epimerase
LNRGFSNGVLVSGVAGFIGANLTRELLSQGRYVVGVDNFSRGTKENLSWTESYGDQFVLLTGDVSDSENLGSLLDIAGIAQKSLLEVIHLAANSDIAAGVSDPRIDLKDTLLTTFSLLEFCKRSGIRRFSFASSSAVYGDHGETRINETTAPLFPTSNYGAMKLASEAIISAACESFLDVGYIFRFPNVVGTPATHGVIFDLVNKLKSNPGPLEVLGDGAQQKSYLHVSDLVDAILYIKSVETAGRVVFNIGPVDEGLTVREIAEIVIQVVSPSREICFTGGDRGWLGDIPRFFYSVDKLSSIGWVPVMGSRESVRRAAVEVAGQLCCA